MQDNRPSVYYEGDVLIIRASAIGSSCLWELVAVAQGHIPDDIPDWLQRAFDEGHEAEPIVLEKLVQQGHTLVSSQDEGELIITDRVKIRFHPDAVMVWKEGFKRRPRVVEIKALEDSNWRKAANGSVGDTYEEYKWQLSVMMHAYNYPATWVALNKGGSHDGDEGRTVTDHQGELLFEHVEVPPITLVQITQRALQIQELVEGEDILLTGRPCDDTSHFPCRFLHLRPEPEDQPDPTTTLVVDEASDERVNQLAKQYVYLTGQIDEHKQRADEIKQEIIRLAGDHKKVQASQWEIPVVTGSSNSLDWPSVPKELKAQLDQYRKHSSYKYIRKPKRLD